MSRRFGAAAGLLALIVVACGCSSANDGTAGSIGPGSTAAVAASGGSTLATPPRSTVTGGTGPAGNAVSLAGQARSVETTGGISGLTSVHLAGPSVLTAMGDVIDHSGRQLGPGTLKVAGSDLVVTGPGIRLTSRLRVQPGQVSVSGTTTLTLSGRTTIGGANLTFQPPPPPPPSTGTPAPSTPAPSVTVPPPVPVAGPVRVDSANVQVTGNALGFLDAPITLPIASSEADLSWAGSGAITIGSGSIQAPFLGVRAQQLDATLHRGGGTVDVRGTGLALQAFANGVPQMRVPARVDILSTHATTGFAGRRRAFVWTPRNLGPTYDMAILRVRPGNAAAGGVHVGLAPMPAMFGGEPHALVGGDTSGLKTGNPIDSLISRNGDDKRTIGYDGPAGVQLVLVLEGNFDPIVVSVTTS